MEDLISFMQWHKERGPAPKEEVMEPILDGEPRVDGYLDKEVKALVAERDRLAAENAELRAEKNYAEVDANKYRAAMMAANARLDALRKAVPEGDSRSWSMLDAVYSILYPKETDNGN